MTPKHLRRDAQAISVGLTSTRLLGPNPRRYAVLIGCPLTNRITLGFGDTVVLDSGITLYPAGPPFILLYDHVGQAITEQISAIAAVGAQTVGVVDIFWP